MAMNKRWSIIGGSVVATAVAMGTYYEGNSLKAYLDIGGTPTICEGRTQGVFIGMTATQAQCDAWLTDDMEKELKFVDAHLLKKEPDEIRAALTDFTYNEGEGHLLESTALVRFNRGDQAGGCTALKLWNEVHGNVVNGLVVRREGEYELCMQGVDK